MEKVKAIIKNQRSSCLILLQLRDDTVASTMCDKLLGKACKRTEFVLLAIDKKEVIKLYPSYNLLEDNAGVIVIKQKMVLKFLTAEEIVSLREDKFRDLMQRLNRNYPDRAALKFSDEAIVPFHGFKLEPFNMGSGSASVPKKKDELQDEWQKTAHSEPRAYNAPPVIPEKLSLFDVQVVTNRLLDVLHPGESVCKALRRLKEHQPIFDQVTEDVMLLVENGNIGIYESTKEEIWQKANSNEVIDENVPNLFYFDAASGLYYDGTSGMYYDPTSGYYCCYDSGFWYRYNDNTESWELM